MPELPVIAGAPMSAIAIFVIVHSREKHVFHPHPRTRIMPCIQRSLKPTSGIKHLVAVLLELLLGLVVHVGVLLGIDELAGERLLALVVGSTLDFSPLLESVVWLVSIFPQISTHQ